MDGQQAFHLGDRRAESATDRMIRHLETIDALGRLRRQRAWIEYLYQQEGDADG
jgi:hypothetical protein